MQDVARRQPSMQDVVAAGQGELPVPPELQAGAEAGVQDLVSADQLGRHVRAQGCRHAISAAVPVLDEAGLASSSTVVEGCEEGCESDCG